MRASGKSRASLAMTVTRSAAALSAGTPRSRDSTGLMALPKTTMPSGGPRSASQAGEAKGDQQIGRQQQRQQNLGGEEEHHFARRMILSEDRLASAIGAEDILFGIMRDSSSRPRSVSCSRRWADRGRAISRPSRPPAPARFP